jgi:hypothetical protein
VYLTAPLRATSNKRARQDTCLIRTAAGRRHKTQMKRNRRASVEDRWTKTVRDEHGTTQSVPSANHGKGSRWRARYVDDQGREHEKLFGRKIDAQAWINKQISDQETGTWTDPALSGVT